MTSSLNVAIALGKGLGEVMDEFHTAPPTELFHYTDANGLIGLFQNKGELWATDVRCMNDTGELTWGHDLMRRALAAKVTHPAHDLLARLLAHPAYVSPLVMATSFSEQRDLLSQWRAYAADGSGFAIGFASAELLNLTLEDKEPLHKIVRVEYDPKKQATRARRLVRRALDGLKPLARKKLSHQDDQFLVMSLGLLLPTFAAMCKNSGFEEEKEYRIVLRAHQDPILPTPAAPYATVPVCLFRAGKYGVTPFLKLRFPTDVLNRAITRVVIGPKATGLETEQKVRALLANAGIKTWSTIPVERARASYR